MKKSISVKLVFIYLSIGLFLLGLLTFMFSVVGFNNIAGFYGFAKKIDYYNIEGIDYTDDIKDTQSPTPVDTEPAPITTSSGNETENPDTTGPSLSPSLTPSPAPSTATPAPTQTTGKPSTKPPQTTQQQTTAPVPTTQSPTTEPPATTQPPQTTAQTTVPQNTGTPGVTPETTLSPV